jgi:hypothetical protein
VFKRIAVLAVWLAVAAPVAVGLLSEARPVW